MTNHQTQENIQRAWVVFSGKADLPWLRILRPGFRHCFVLLNDGTHWLSVEPLLTHMEVQIYHTVPADFDLPEWLSRRGQVVVEAPIARHHKKPAPWMVFSCVEVVKRVLGVHKRFIVTPWQLYRYLERMPQSARSDQLDRSMYLKPADQTFFSKETVQNIKRANPLVRTTAQFNQKGDLSWEV